MSGRSYNGDPDASSASQSDGTGGKRSGEEGDEIMITSREQILANYDKRKVGDL